MFGHTLAIPKWLKGDGTLEKIDVNGSTHRAKITTLASHGLSYGQIVTISGATGDLDLNGSYEVVPGLPSEDAETTNTFMLSFRSCWLEPKYTKMRQPVPIQTRNLAWEMESRRSNSGIGDLPGGDVMLTLGLWENQVGSEFVQASTWLHELGHNLGLMHGGSQALTVSPPDPLEPNCKPNYQSVMSYLYQVNGLIDATGERQINYSGEVLGPLSENSLNESTGLGTMAYRARWYVPKSSSFLDKYLGTSVVRTKHCDGTPMPSNVTTEMVRVDSPGLVAPLDWNANGILPDPGILTWQDVNFNGSLATLPDPPSGFVDPPFLGFDGLEGCQPPTGGSQAECCRAVPRRRFRRPGNRFL